MILSQQSKSDLFVKIDGIYQLKLPYRIFLTEKILDKIYTRHYNERKERGGLIVFNTHERIKTFTAQKVIPIRNISDKPSESYYPREDRFHKELGKYLEDPSKEIPFFYHTHPVRTDLPKNMLKWLEQIMRQEPSEYDFNPFPIWSKNLNAEFDYPQLLFTRSPLSYFYVVWCFGAGTNIPLPSFEKTSILQQNIEIFDGWLKNGIWPRIKSLYTESSRLEKIMLGLIGLASAALTYQAVKRYSNFSMNLVLGLLAYIQTPATTRNEDNPIYLQTLSEQGILNMN